MEISLNDLSRHFASLSDAELLAISSEDLTDLARQCYHGELGRRHLSRETGLDRGVLPIDSHHEVPQDWLDTAATACSFQTGTGGGYAEDAERACSILREA